MPKRRVAVIGTVGKSLRINVDATVGATIGTDLKFPDGSLVTLENLAASLISGGGSPTPVTPTLWSLIQDKPPNIVQVANLATTGLVVRLADGTWPTIAAGTAGKTLYDNGTVWTSTDAISVSPTSAVTLKYNGTPALLTGANGIQVQPTGTGTFIEMLDSSGTLAGRIGRNSSGSYSALTDLTVGGVVKLQGKVGSSVVDCYIGDPDGSSMVLYNGQFSVTTLQNGIAVYNAGFPADPNDVGISLRKAAGDVQEGYFGFPNSDTLTIENDIDGGGLEIIVNAVSSAPELVLTYTAGGALTLSYNGDTKFATSSAGASVTGALDISTGSITTANSTLTLSNGGENLAVFTKDGSAALYYDNVVKLATSSAGVSVTGTVTTTAGVLITAAALAGYTQASVNETITGQWTFAGNGVSDVVANFSVVDGTSSINIVASSPTASRVAALRIYDAYTGQGGLGIHTRPGAPEIRIDQLDTSGIAVATWAEFVPGAGVSLRYASTEQAKTQSYSASGNTSGLAVADVAGTLRSVAFGQRPGTNYAVNVTLNARNSNEMVRMAGTSLQVILPTSTAGADIPDGSIWLVTVGGTASAAVAQASGSALFWMGGAGSSPSGNRTLAVAAAVYIYKRNDSTYFIWGWGIS